MHFNIITYFFDLSSLLDKFSKLFYFTAEIEPFYALESSQFISWQKISDAPNRSASLYNTNVVFLPPYQPTKS